MEGYSCLDMATKHCMGIYNWGHNELFHWVALMTPPMSMPCAGASAPSHPHHYQRCPIASMLRACCRRMKKFRNWAPGGGLCLCAPEANTNLAHEHLPNHDTHPGSHNVLIPNDQKSLKKREQSIYCVYFHIYITPPRRSVWRSSSPSTVLTTTL